MKHVFDCCKQSLKSLLLHPNLSSTHLFTKLSETLLLRPPLILLYIVFSTSKFVQNSIFPAFFNFVNVFHFQIFCHFQNVICILKLVLCLIQVFWKEKISPFICCGSFMKIASFINIQYGSKTVVLVVCRHEISKYTLWKLEQEDCFSTRVPGNFWIPEFRELKCFISII
jgi:hypothetical protein